MGTNQLGIDAPDPDLGESEKQGDATLRTNKMAITREIFDTFMLGSRIATLTDSGWKVANLLSWRLDHFSAIATRGCMTGLQICLERLESVGELQIIEPSLAVDRLILEMGLEDLANASPMTIEDRTIDEVDRVQVRDNI